MKWIFSLIIVLVLNSCGAFTTFPPKTYNYDKTQTISKNYEETWKSLIQWFSTHNTPIKNLDKNSGFIATDMNLATNNFALYYDCGKLAGGSSNGNMTGNFNVLIEKVGELQTKVTITTFFKGDNVTNMGSYCNSTGLLEKEIFEFLK